jgi:hypothetical protein
MIPELGGLEQVPDIFELQDLFFPLEMAARDIKISSKELALIILISEFDDPHDNSAQRLQCLLG